jgi:Tetracyclin repressor-like, C-terminal domain
MNENMHRGEYLEQSKKIQKLNIPAIDGLRKVYERGVKAKVFRKGIDPIDLHMSISALSVFNVANRYTFSLIFKRDLESKTAQNTRCKSIVEMIERAVIV